MHFAPPPCDRAMLDAHFLSAVADLVYLSKTGVLHIATFKYSLHKFGDRVLHLKITIHRSRHARLPPCASRIYSVSQKSSPPLKLFAIFSLRLIVFP